MYFKMKKISEKTLNVKNGGKATDKKVLSLKGTKKFFLSLSLGIILFTSCNREDYEIIENDDVIENTDNSSLGVRDFKNWFESQKVAKDLIGDQELNWSNAELKTMRDGKTLQVSIEIYKGENSLGNDSIRELVIAKVKDGFIGNVKVLSFHDREYAHAKYYSLSGRILEEGEYYSPKQLYMSLKRYTVEEREIEMRIVRLKSGTAGTESNPCADTIVEPNSATPLYIDGNYNIDAYNYHTYVWGKPNANNSYVYFSEYPNWNEYPKISSSDYSEINLTQIRVDDIWVSYGYHSVYGDDTPIHSAFIKEVKDGKITKLNAKCGAEGIYTYNPDCDVPMFASYIRDDNGNECTVKYYRKK
jgi:hypothetical protein